MSYGPNLFVRRWVLICVRRLGEESFSSDRKYMTCFSWSKKLIFARVRFRGDEEFRDLQFAEAKVKARLLASPMMVGLGTGEVVGVAEAY